MNAVWWLILGYALMAVATHISIPDDIVEQVEKHYFFPGVPQIVACLWPLIFAVCIISKFFRWARSGVQ